jgi:hypothetical protein
MTDIDILSKVPDEMLTAAASRFPDAAAATENLQRVILRLPDGHRAEVTFARISEKEGRSIYWSWTPAGAVLIE